MSAFPDERERAAIPDTTTFPTFNIADITGNGHDSSMSLSSNMLSVGDRIRLSGGYSMEQAWLGGKPSIDATVVAFHARPNACPDCVVKLEEALTCEGFTGEWAVLTRRFMGATWRPDGVVHVELCDFEPLPQPQVPFVADREHGSWDARRKGEWVESHASYCWTR